MAYALIFGASGISGWSLLNQARVYPTTNTFTRITGTTNRPLNDLQFPSDDRIQLVSGVDLTKTADEVATLLKEEVADVDTVSHVFFVAYVQRSDPDTSRIANTKLLEVAVSAIEAVSKNIQAVILQTGGKGYGTGFIRDGSIQLPLVETNPRLPEPWASQILYYSQYDSLKKLSVGKSWSFSEIRPDAIVGFTPSSNAMNLAQGIAVYLTIYREVEGTGATVSFPGSTRGYHAKHSDTFQDILSRMEIFAALNRDKCGQGTAFNVANGQTVTWSQIWPKPCEHFGLIGAAPGEQQNSVSIPTFVTEHRNVWLDLAQRYLLHANVVDEQNWEFIHMMLVHFDFDRQYDLSRSRSVGFLEEVDTVMAYITSWERMRAAKLLPPPYV